MRKAVALFKNRTAVVGRRFLNLHEYQSVHLMRKFGVATPEGEVSCNAEHAMEVAEKIGKPVAVKAQVLAGGRGLGHFDNGFKSGVHLVNTPREVKDVTHQMIGARLITKQTGSDGRPCATVLVVEQIQAASEKYLAIMMDRESLGPVVIASAAGGVTIEDIAEKHPELIIKERVDINKGLSAEGALAIAKRMRFTSDAAAKSAASSILGLYEMFIKSDATMVEVNPFTETKDGRVVAVDAKVNFDDNAFYRQTEIFAHRDYSQEEEHEVLAALHNLNYVQLGGNIGCMVNGAGLAMATMDIVKLYGGQPANFLDVGGGATEEQVKEAFKILLHGPEVQVILVNIFGGIMRCDTIATGVINATRELKVHVPVVVRLQGTNVEKANKLLEESGLNLIRASDLDDAAAKAVAALGKN